MYSANLSNHTWKPICKPATERIPKGGNMNEKPLINVRAVPGPPSLLATCADVDQRFFAFWGKI